MKRYRNINIGRVTATAPADALCDEGGETISDALAHGATAAAAEHAAATAERAAAAKPAATVDITPTWGEWGRIYSSFAESGERKVCRALREDFARAMAAAEVMRELRDTFTDEQAAIVARVLCDELRKQGF